MDNSESEKEKIGLGRRAFLRYSGAAVGGSLCDSHKAEASRNRGRDETGGPHSSAEPLRGPWRLWVDRENVGHQHEWYKREPTDAVAKAIAVTVPSCWQEFVPDFPGGVGWYFTDFAIPGNLEGRILRLKFWAVDYFAQAWLNGEELGSHEGGFTPFEFDITRCARFRGENRLVVRVVDPPRTVLGADILGLPGWERMCDGVAGGFRFMEIPMAMQSFKEGFTSGGIWEPVELLSTGPVFVSDAFIEPKLSKMAIEAHLEITDKEPFPSDLKIVVTVAPWKHPEQICGQNERTLRCSPGSTALDVHVDVREPHPWCVEDPYLYVAVVSVLQGQRVRHRTAVRFGLREFTIKDGHFYLNGDRIFIKGGHFQGTYPRTLAYPPTQEFAYREVRIIKEAGFNFCRLQGRPTPLPTLDAADELGLLLQVEPAISEIRNSPQMLPRGVREVTELLKRDRNRPAVVVWNLANEEDPAMAMVGELCQLARRLDPTRVITETTKGPSHYYVPYSDKGIPYLAEHGYPGAPISEDAYEYWHGTRVPGNLFFVSEYGYGGMDDVELSLAQYGDRPKVFMEDYRGFVRLKELRNELFEHSPLFKKVFADLRALTEASQSFQADVIRLHTEAMRSNPDLAGYNLVQVFDSNAFEVDGIVDFWRNNRKKAFSTVQELNRPLLLVARCSPMNIRSGEHTHIQVSLVNEAKIRGRKRLVVAVRSPSGREVFRKELATDTQPWVSVLFEESLNISGESWRYTVEAELWDSPALLVRNDAHCTVFRVEDFKWPSAPFGIFDVNQELAPFLKARGIRYSNFDPQTREPDVIVVTPFSALWRQPEEFRKLIRLLGLVQRGCTALFLGMPEDGPEPASGLRSSASVPSPLTVTGVFPFKIEVIPERWGLRIGPYSWGLKDPIAGVPAQGHPIFEGFSSTGLMGTEHGNIAPTQRIRTEATPIEDTGPAVQMYPHGKGRIVLSIFNLLPNLRQDALAEKLLSSLVNYCNQGLPSELAPESREMLETMQSKERSFQESLKGFVRD